MSRIGNAIINVPSGVEVSVDANNLVTVKGPKGELTQQLDSCVKLENKEGVITFERVSEAKDHKAKHGLYRSLVNNMVIGVSEGYKKEMELVGVGYRAQTSGQQLELALGFSHNVIIVLPEEVKVTTETERGKNPKITLESHDKQLIGQVAAKIRSLRKPEPFKGKGIKFVGEHIRRKAGKAAAK
ncbi:MAG: 50S ribosomal protein L6 [Flavobacteriales bacterium]|nr:50S ribosomal protein L6 [Flavobacteriales bacterium]